MLFKSNRQAGLPDYWLPALAFGLAIFGIAMISSASALVAFSRELSTHFFFIQQLKSLAISVIAFSICASIPFRAWRRWAIVLLLMSIVGLIMVFVPGIGAIYGTAHSWIVLPVLGSFQPVEFTKLALIIYLASWMAGREREIGTFQQGFVPFIILLASNLFLVALQPDFGSILVIIVVAAAMYLVGGANLKHFTGGGVIFVILGYFIISSKPYIKKRFLTFLNPELDPEGIGYHIRQILIAVGSGGWWGLGFGRSRQKYQYLPEPQSDSIVSVMAEELGFIRISFFLMAILALIWRGFRTALNCADRFGMLMATGIIVWIAAQSVLNIAVNVAMAPMTGVPLPFISHGGSSLMMLMVAIGILFSISREAQPETRIGRSTTEVWLRSTGHHISNHLRKRFKKPSKQQI